MSQIEKIKHRIQILIDQLTDESKLQSENTRAPGNPYILGINARIGGLKSALKIIEEESK